jgi:hypothetical protein
MRTRGQALAEFALIAPIFFLVIGAVIQGGVYFWTQNTLTQAVRDTARWVASQPYSPCSAIPDGGAAGLGTMADAIARSESLLGYRGTWTTSIRYVDTLPAVPASQTAFEVAWSAACPVVKSADTAWVTIRGNMIVPTFLPFLSGSVSSTVVMKMEPVP